MAAPFEFSEDPGRAHPRHALARLTRLARIELEEEMAELRETIAELEAILADEAKLRAVIKDELAEVRTPTPAPRAARSPRPGDIDIEDLIDDEELVVTMSAKGYVKTVAADAFRPGPRRPGVAGAKLRDEDYVTPPHPHLGPRLPAVLLEPRPGVPAQGPRDPP
jgi:DNA gyrase subunit A